ncbi:MAG: 2-amino-4-hydroxy-6-hydroxymethyldihydropteridine diphosphokinase [Spirochaetaceae bacterium]
MNKVYLSLGSNIGNRIKHLKNAIDLIKNTPEIFNVISSCFYETAPQGYTDQDYFINCVISLETDIEPIKLLKICQDIEKKLKRVRLFRWGPRTIDIDILLFGSLNMNSKILEIPHPRMFDRAFVMVPLSELDSKFLENIKNFEDQEIRKIV